MKTRDKKNKTLTITLKVQKKQATKIKPKKVTKSNPPKAKTSKPLKAKKEAVKKVDKSKNIRKKKVLPKKKPQKKVQTKKVKKQPLKAKAASKVVKQVGKKIKKVSKKKDDAYKPKKKSAKKEKKPKKEGGKHEGFTDDEYKRFKDIIADLQENKNVSQLKEMLRANSQSMSGNKQELCEKIADGKIHGAIPRCSKCGGGFIKYNWKTDTYWCNGYMDDDIWKHCHFKGKTGDVERSSWVDN